MVKVPNAVEILPKISTSVTDRQTDRRQTDGQQQSSRSLKINSIDYKVC